MPGSLGKDARKDPEHKDQWVLPQITPQRGHRLLGTSVIADQPNRHVEKAYIASVFSVLLSLLLGWSMSAQADGLTESMRSSTVPVVCLTSPTRIGAGSGFIVAMGKHVVTNQHVVECADKGGKVGVMSASGELVQATVAWKSETKDLAILSIEKGWGGKPVTFATRTAIDERDKVIVAGYPGAAQRSARDFGKVSFAEGIISKFTELDSSTGTIRHIQITAPVNPGNSGGPLFNEFGQVVGINVQKSLTAVLVVDPTARLGVRQERVPLGEGVAWAILSDELLVELERLDLPFTATRSKPNAFSAEFGKQPILFSIAALAMLLAAVSAGLLLTRRGRVAIKDAVTRGRDFATQRVPSPAKPIANPVLRGITGPYAQATMPMDDKPIAIGRDANICQLVMPPDAADIGRRHCTVRWERATRTFLLEDCWTTNGTFLDSGEIVEPSKPRSIKPGDRFYLANRQYQFEVAVESQS
jgi:S1-C subfamily serine protease